MIDTMLLGLMTLLFVGGVSYFAAGTIALVKYGLPEYTTKSRSAFDVQHTLNDDDPIPLARLHTAILLILVAGLAISTISVAAIAYLLWIIGTAVKPFVVAGVLLI